MLLLPYLEGDFDLESGRPRLLLCENRDAKPNQLSYWIELDKQLHSSVWLNTCEDLRPLEKTGNYSFEC